MKCYDEFPISTIVYNVVTLGGALVVGSVVAAQFGTGALIGYVMLLVLAVVGILTTVCSRCASYYGRRCALGFGMLVPLLAKKGDVREYFRTPMQFVYLALLGLALLLPIVGAISLVINHFSVAYLMQIILLVGLLLAGAIPHPRLVCSHCRQGKCGACPVGRKIHQARGG